MTEEITLAQALENEYDKLSDSSASESKEAVSEEVLEEESSVELAEADTDSESGEGEKVEVSPPEHWSEEDKQAFAKLDESGREWALRLESNFHKGIEEKGSELNKFKKAIDPYRHLLGNMDEATAIQQLLAAQSYLQSNPKEGIAWLKKSLGIQDEPKEEPEDEFADPEIKKLREQIKHLTSQSEQQANEAEQRRQRVMLAEIQQFREATGDDGKLLHPHFEKAYGVMAGLMQSGAANSMEEAYERAVWSLPEYRDEVVEQRAKAEVEKAREEAERVAEAAKKRAATVQGKASAKAKPKEQTLSDALSENYDKSIKGEL